MNKTESGFSTAFTLCVAAARKENTILEDTGAVSRDGTKTSQAKSGSDLRPRPDKLPLGLRGRTKDYNRPIVVPVTQF